MPKKLTKKIVVDLHSHMARKFHFKIIQKSDSNWMPTVARALDAFGIMDKEMFMKRFALTVVDPIFDIKFVYLPDEPGVGNWSKRVGQCCRIGHETGHTIQGEEIDWLFNYGGSMSKRSRFESLVLVTDMEVCKMLTGKLPSTARLANRLKHYHVRSRDIRVTKRELDSVAYAVNQGAVATRAGKEIRRFLKSRGVI